jgi:hypothetical protein
MPTSTELMQLARACAERASLPRRKRKFPSFSEVEDACGDEYEALLGVLHEDEIYQPADLDEQEQLVAAIRAALPEAQHHLLEALIDNQAAQVWLQQEGAFHLGMALGLRLAAEGHGLDREDEDEEDDDLDAERAREDAVRFGPPRNDPAYGYDEDEEEDEEDEDKG